MKSCTPEQCESILLAGSGRSGTTWISAVLSECHGAVPIFEPLNQKRVPGVPIPSRMTDFPGTYLRDTSENRAWEAFFHEVFAGNVSNCWTRQDWKSTSRLMLHVPLGERVSYRIARWRYQSRAERARVQVIKTIRGNLLLHWLAVRFPVRIEFVIRHPCAVVASRLRHGWSTSLDGILQQPTLIADHLQPLRWCIDRASDDVDRMAILWCVENLIPLVTRRAGQVTLHRYEAFRRSPQHEFNGLFERLGLQPRKSAEMIARRFHSNTSTAVQQRQREWHAGLGPARGRRVLDICHTFGLRIYGPTWEPLDENLPSVVTTSRSPEAAPRPERRDAA